MPQTPSSEPALVVQRAYDLALWLLPKSEKFSRAYRFSLGDRIVSTTLDLLTALVEAAYSTQKSALLDQANRRANTLRYLLRMAKDLRLLSADSQAYAAARLEEIGRMIGGWRKSIARQQ